MNRLLLISISPAALLVILIGPFMQVGVAQLSLPASLVGGLVALQMLLAGLRPWLGRLGDRHPAGDAGRRTLLGVGLSLTWLSLPLLLLGLVRLGRLWPAASPGQRAMALVGEIGVMLIVGLGNQLTQTMQAALLLEPLPADRRSRIVQRLWIVLNLFTVLASGLSALLLQGLNRASLNQQLLGLWGLWMPVVGLGAVLGLGGRADSVVTSAGWTTAARLLLLPAAELAGSLPSRLRGGLKRLLPRRRYGHAAVQGTSSQSAVAAMQPQQALRGGLLAVLLLAHAPLYGHDVLLDPWATLLFGWPLAATAWLTGCWALGTLLGQLWALKRAVPPREACLAVALFYALMGLRGVVPGLQLLPIPLLVASLGLSSGWLQLWLAGEVGRRCSGNRLGETVGWLGAALVLSRSLGVALTGPLLDLSAMLCSGRTPAAFALAFGLLALSLLAGGACCGRLRRIAMAAEPAGSPADLRVPVPEMADGCSKNDRLWR